MRVLAVLLMLPFPALAQEIFFSPEATEACLAEGGESEACLGKAAEACYSPPGVFSNVAMGSCLQSEADYWDGRLNVAYRDLMAAEKKTAAEMREIGATVPDTVTALRDMQRAWIVFRDAACAYEYSTWGGGTGGGPAHAECTMRLTARQALELERRLGEH